MYAIVKTGGKQYRVERGQHLLVERLAAEEGASVALQPLMYRSEETVFDADGLEQVQVTAKILGHERGEKLRVVKFKPKRGYKRRNGHRQELTRIEIVDIALGGKSGGRKAAKPAAAEKSAASDGGAKDSKATEEATENGA
jgi:large subunit ribosomal protein L21